MKKIKKPLLVVILVFITILILLTAFIVSIPIVNNYTAGKISGSGIELFAELDLRGH